MRYAITAVLAAALVGTASAAPIVTDTATYGGSTYYLLSASNWTDAQAAAVALGGNLVTVNDAAENAFLYNTWGGGAGGEGAQGLWIGLNDSLVEGVFAWVSGEPVGYTNWDPGEPNNLGDEDYVYIRPFSGGTWNDLANNGDYDGTRYGVVEVKQTPEPVSLVVFGGLLVGGGWLARRRMKAAA